MEASSSYSSSSTLCRENGQSIEALRSINFLHQLLLGAFGMKELELLPEKDLDEDIRFIEFITRDWRTREKVMSCLARRVRDSPYLSTKIYLWLTSLRSPDAPQLSSIKDSLDRSFQNILERSVDYFKSLCKKSDQLGKSSVKKLASGVLEEFLPEGELADLLNGTDPRLCRIQKMHLLKRFDSASAPLMFSLSFSGNTAPLPGTLRLLLKTRDDVGADYSAMAMFKLFNRIWGSASMSRKPILLTYEIQELTPQSGLVEIVRDSVSVEGLDWSQLQGLDQAEFDHFVNSLAGAFTASFVLGVCDRHRDNMMLQQRKTFFHIDFGRIAGDSLPIDASLVPIPSGLRDLLLKNNSFESWLNLCGESFSVLRKNASLLLAYAEALFEHKNSRVTAWLVTSLGLGMLEKEAIAKFRSLISASESASTKIKNVGHTMSHSGFLTTWNDHFAGKK